MNNTELLKQRTDKGLGCYNERISYKWANNDLERSEVVDIIKTSDIPDDWDWDDHEQLMLEC